MDGERMISKKKPKKKKVSKKIKGVKK